MKKRVWSLLLALCMVLCLMPTAAFAAGSTASADITGTGTADDPYLIYTAAGLKAFRDKVNGQYGLTQQSGAHAKLMNNIVLNEGSFDENGNWSESGTPDQWTPIGDSSNPYAGTFDGNGKTIQGVYVNSQGSAGLFSTVGGATIKNIAVTGYVQGRGDVGGIVGRMNGGTITGCSNAATVRFENERVVACGGIVGCALTGTIANCENVGSVLATLVGQPYYLGLDVGGIVGEAGTDKKSTTIEACANFGSVTAIVDAVCDFARIGGIVGYISYYGSLVDCYYAGSLSLTERNGKRALSSNLGGIFGGKILSLDYESSAASYPAVMNCYSVGTMTYTGSGQANIGGIGGETKFHRIINCYWLSGTADIAVAGDTTYVTDAEAKTKAAFADGTVLELLKANRSSGPWTDQCQYSNTVGMTLPLLSWQVSKATDYPISVVDKAGEKVPIHSLNCDNVLGDGTVCFQYDEANQKGILTLDGADLASEEAFPINADQIDNLEIVLKGKNRIRSDTMAGIVACNLTFSGDGSLDISSAGQYNWMVDCTGNFTVNGPNVKITSVDYALFLDNTLTVNSGTLELIATGTYGVAVDSGFSGPFFVLGDDRIMIAGRAADGSDAEVTALTELSKLKSAHYIKIFDKYVPITYAPGAYGGEQAYQKNKVYGTAFTLDDQHFTRTGYRQTGWAVTDGGDAAYAFSGTYDGNTALTLYPVWQAVPYSVQYDLAGGTVTGNPEQYTIESDSFVLNNPRRDGYTFTGWSGTDLTGTNNLTVRVAQGSTGDRSYTANWRDSTAPVVDGLADDRVYCAAVDFTATDNDGAVTVTVNGTPLQGENGRFTLAPAQGRQKVIVSDATGNTTEFTVTVNDGHTLEWQSENGRYWQKCKFCDSETDKRDIPVLTINGGDRVCRTQDYRFSFTLPDGATDATYGYEFIGFGDSPLMPDVNDGVCSGVIPSNAYAAEEDSFKVTVRAQTADGFTIYGEKTVTIENAHTGGTATCAAKAVCAVCGESYGEINAANHADLQYFLAKAATQTDEGNTEYWYCSGCGKYYRNAEATAEIARADTVTAKLPAETKPAETKPATQKTAAAKSPQTGAGAATGVLLLGGLGLIFTAVGSKKKKSREN